MKNWDYWVEWEQSEVWCKQEIMCKQEMMTVDCVCSRIDMMNVLILALIWWVCWLQLKDDK